MEIYKKQTLSETFAVYFEKRMARILLLGIISGFPWVLIGSSLSLWLKEDGLSRSTIGWAGLIFAVYAFNYLWAPIIDRIRIPWLTNKIGHRRGWIVTMQAVILVSLICWSIIDPTTNLALVITVGLIIAVASATQDITVDALRIEQIGENEGKSMQAGAAMAVVGWWTGYKLGGVIALNAAEYFGEDSFDCVVALDVIEHLEKADGLRLLEQMEIIARKKVIIFTPNGFLEQEPFDGNEWQRHISGWEVDEMREMGFEIIGINGWKALRGERAKIAIRPISFWKRISYLSGLYVTKNPEFAFQILCQIKPHL